MFTKIKSLKKTGGILAISSGILAIFAAQLMFVIAGIHGTSNSASFAVLLWVELGTVVLSFLTAFLGALSMSIESKIPAGLLVIIAVLAALLGGLPVALFMTVALVGGVLVMLADDRLELMPAE